jgi:hydroxymethylpyrimidine pyrophosphatase-like HAD family hydrolase
MSKQTIILCDVDKTLIDPQYQLTIDIRDTVKSVQRISTIGLCSDSALLSLEFWAKKIGAAGYLVGELGAVVQDMRNKTIVATNPVATSWLIQLRDVVILDFLQELPDITIAIGDSVQFIREGLKTPSFMGKVAFVNGYRFHSVGIHMRSFDHQTNTLRCDSVGLAALRVRIELILSKMGQPPVTIDENPEYGIIIIHARSTSKKNGVLWLLERFPETQIFMIGDSIADHIIDSPVVHCAVGNASEAFKEKCQYVSRFQYTEGVQDILNHLLKKYI